MRKNEILTMTGHRPWPLPDTPPDCYQEWHHTLFLHFEVPVEEITPHLPPGMSADTFNNTAWVSVTAFTIRALSLHLLVNLPVAGKIRELNIRTYVQVNSWPGIYMFHITSDCALFNWCMRHLLKIPYRTAALRATEHAFKGMYACYQLDVLYEPGPVIRKTGLDKWLTERYAIFVPHRDHLLRYEIHHPEWQLQQVSFTRLSVHCTQPELASLHEPAFLHAHYSRRQRVFLWAPARL